jgi:mono/diheme cytochrome c family protein
MSCVFCPRLIAHSSQLLMSEFIGRFHPLLVHLPIGVLLLACFFQLVAASDKYAHLRHAIGITLLWGMVTAIASCITGYLLAGSGDYDESLVGRHQWMGIGVALLSALYYVLYTKKVTLKFEWLMPVLLIVGISITGHLGGSLTHGSDYLTAALEDAGTDNTFATTKKPIPDVQEAVAYTDIVQPLLQSKCYSCHGPNKQKGKLRMDQPDLLMKGGKDGLAIETGKPDESEMIKRLLLEKSDEHHMPPKEKPQLTEKEIAILHWWIASGASFNKKTKELQQPEKIKPILVSLQNTAVEQKALADVPSATVEKADEAAIKKLKDAGVVVMPVALNSNYLSASFITATLAGDKEVALLLPLKKQLVWCKLNDTKITDASAATIAQCINLSRLDLSNTAVTDKSLNALAALQQLQSLKLVNTKITAAGLLSLKGNKQLQSVYFYKTGVQRTDWPTLSKTFPKLRLDSGGYQVPLFDTDTMLVKPPKINQ